MSEATIMSGLATAIKAMAEFEDADVVVNDWEILDKSTAGAPFVIIENAEDFTSRQDVPTPQTSWQILVTLVEKFVNAKSSFQTTFSNLGTRRQAIIDKINSTNIRSAGGLSGVNIPEVRGAGGFSYIYPAYLSPEQRAEATPDFVAQRIILVCEEF